jgi:hypothetical protein
MAPNTVSSVTKRIQAAFTKLFIILNSFVYVDARKPALNARNRQFDQNARESSAPWLHLIWSGEKVMRADAVGFDCICFFWQHPRGGEKDPAPICLAEGSSRIAVAGGAPRFEKVREINMNFDPLLLTGIN